MGEDVLQNISLTAPGAAGGASDMLKDISLTAPGAAGAGGAGGAAAAAGGGKPSFQDIMKSGGKGALGALGGGGGGLGGLNPMGGGLDSINPMGMAGNTAVAAINVADKALMGDKNFGAQSEAIDQAVHGVSKTLMKSGNPIAMGVGVAIEGANFLTKATGQNVQGFDMDINSTGYAADMGHMSSKANRDFLGAIGLGGLNTRKADAQLKKRNEQAMMALKAANAADTTKFEQEARMNSVDNVIRNNQTALEGGLNTQMLTE